MPDRHQGKSSRLADQREAARQLRVVLRAVDDDDLNVNSVLARRMLRRIEGAITALEATGSPNLKRIV